MPTAMLKVKIGISSKDGTIYGDYEKCKSCHRCVQFNGYGAHWFAGRCKEKNIEIGYSEYSKIAPDCDAFRYKPQLLEDTDDDNG